ILAHRVSAIDDERIFDTLKSLTNDVFRDSNNTSDEITHNIIDKLSKESFPPCMQQINLYLNKHHKIKHLARQQYILFLKGIGLSIDEAIKYWKSHFLKVMDLRQFESEYAYNIKHRYGLVGSRTNYKPYSCVKIISEVSPLGRECHGCPFRHEDLDTLKRKFTADKVKHSDNIIQLARSGKFQHACGAYFDSIHGIDDKTSDHTPNTPNEYFNNSISILQKKGLSCLKKSLRDNKCDD
ncbi:hypothetical protein A3Q56_05343, partial [Intoshia linei]